MSKTALKQHLVLASSSPFRRRLLEQLNLPFRVIPADIDESRKGLEDPETLVTRLSVMKARSVAESQPNSLLIGSDQVAVHGRQILGKPKDRDEAVSQLSSASSSTVRLYTGVALFNSRTRALQVKVVPFAVEFRKLSKESIERYLEIERPYACCGSLKADGLGITLLENVSGDDPSALIGLPLIALTRMLEAEGMLKRPA
ncbi:MAG: nucleoside triphosphate pyrophosphatase [Pseudomonadota bacterium]|nr:nucleoside triphosphate pyrophosphatase [Pseudomonadota bacterium]